jgi:alpha-D-ribose 1-methylphosphonate 5-triphosphate synthase subunit PhnH
MPMLPRPWQPRVQQQVFRQLMNVFAYPGRVETLATMDGDAAARQRAAMLLILAVLLDGEVSLADPDTLLSDDDWRRMAARRDVPEHAQFVAARGESPPRFTPCLGSLESPERGATLLVGVSRIGEGVPLWLSGPGVQGRKVVHIKGLDFAWLTRRQTWNAGFPLGVDLVLVDEQRMVALPRTTQLYFQGEL